MSGQGDAAHQPVTVVSAVVVDAGTSRRLLLSVRRPSPYARRHPGVLSTPTLAVPADLFALLAGQLPDPEPGIGMHPVAGPRLRIGRGGHTDSTAGFVLENLFARKLGLAEALVDGSFAAVAQLRFRSHDQVEDPLGTGQSEWTTMLTYLIEVTDGAGALPDATAAYSRLIWADPAKLPQALAQRDALLLDMTLNPIEVCIHGLCIRVAAHLLDQIA